MNTLLESPVFTIVNDPPLCSGEQGGVQVVYGLAGDPPHHGHLEAIRWLAMRAGRVHVALSASHAFGKAMAPYERRHAWLSTLLEELPLVLRQRVVITDVEDRLWHLHPENKVYSIDVMEALGREYPNQQWAWGFGPDNANPAMLNRFHSAAEIAHWPVWSIPATLNWRSTLVRECLDQHNLNALREGMGGALAQEVSDWADTAEGHAWLMGRKK